MSSKKVERTHIYTPRTTLSRILEVTNEDLMESGRSPAHNKEVFHRSGRSRQTSKGRKNRRRDSPRPKKNWASSPGTLYNPNSDTFQFYESISTSPSDTDESQMGDTESSENSRKTLTKKNLPDKEIQGNADKAIFSAKTLKKQDAKKKPGVAKKQKTKKMMSPTQSPRNRCNQKCADEADVSGPSSDSELKKLNRHVTSPVKRSETYSLEVQFSNKKKYVKLLTKEIAHRKQAILDLRQSLVIIRDKLAELGVVVTLDDLTLDKLEALPEKIPSKLLELCGHLLTRQQYMAERLQECSQLDQRIKDDVQVFKEEGVELHKTYDLMVKMNKQWEEPEESNENESTQEVEELVEEMVEELVEESAPPSNTEVACTTVACIEEEPVEEITEMQRVIEKEMKEKMKPKRRRIKSKYQLYVIFEEIRVPSEIDCAIEIIFDNLNVIFADKNESQTVNFMDMLDEYHYAVCQMIVENLQKVRYLEDHVHRRDRCLDRRDAVLKFKTMNDEERKKEIKSLEENNEALLRDKEMLNKFVKELQAFSSRMYKRKEAAEAKAMILSNKVDDLKENNTNLRTMANAVFKAAKLKKHEPQ